MLKLTLFTLILLTQLGSAALVQHANRQFRSNDPLSIPSLRIWYAADVGVLEADASDAEVGDAAVTWVDQSGNGNNALLQTCTLVFTNGAYALQLSTDQNPINPLNSELGSVNTVILAVKTSDTQWVVATVTNDVNITVGGVQSGSAASPHNAAGTPSYYHGVTLFGGTPTRDDLHDVYAAGTVVIGTAIAFDLSGASGKPGILGRSTNASWIYSGLVYEILWFNSALTDEQRIGQVNRLAAKYQ